MRLKFEAFDYDPDYLAVVDEDTDNQVGMVQIGAGVNSSDIDISLFDGKYEMRVKRYDTAVGFVLGVQTVLNHMTFYEAPQSASKKAA
jgi:hypothetical protein